MDWGPMIMSPPDGDIRAVVPMANLPLDAGALSAMTMMPLHLAGTEMQSDAGPVLAAAAGTVLPAQGGNFTELLLQPPPPPDAATAQPPEASTSDVAPMDLDVAANALLLDPLQALGDPALLLNGGSPSKIRIQVQVIGLPYKGAMPTNDQQAAAPRRQLGPPPWEPVVVDPTIATVGGCRMGDR